MSGWEESQMRAGGFPRRSADFEDLLQAQENIDAPFTALSTSSPVVSEEVHKS
jgi:hypothetical protein